jgi:hypothetical protein
MNLMHCAWLHFLFSIAIVASVWAQDTKETPKQPAPDKKALEAALKTIELLEVRPALKDDKIARIKQPLLTFGDLARKHENGTLWAWGEKGRPLAFVELFRGEDPRWVHAATLTSTERIVMTTSDASWTPEKTQIEFAAIPDAPAPADKEAQRLRQIKDLARRFTAFENWEGQRHELRLLVQPVWRYSDAKQMLQDGAVFVLAHGTNPEILLFIEAQGKTLETSAWKFGAVRSGSAELHLAIDEKEVWKIEPAPGIVGRARDPYWLFLTRAVEAE